MSSSSSSIQPTTATGAQQRGKKEKEPRNTRHRPDEEEDEEFSDDVIEFNLRRRELNISNPVSQCWGQVCGVVWGVITGVTIVITILKMIHVPCPYSNGLECSGRGICVKGRCDCTQDPFFSGSACQDTLAPGYIEATGEVCSGRGILSPFSVYSDIVEDCQVFGWAHERCINKINVIQEKIDARSTGSSTEVLTREEVKTTPICFCRPPFGGKNCELDARSVLSNIEGKVCSDQFNSSVDYFFNDTGRSSSGLQCEATAQLFLLDSLKSLDFTVAQRIRSLYLKDFARGFCAGAYIQIANDAVIPLKQEQTNYRCRCREPYYGEICQFGRCPTDDSGRICSGQGNPLYGFGVERNTTRNDEGECDPICRGAECKESPHPYSAPYCKPDARFCDKPELPVRCPKEKPFRCSYGGCTAGPARSKHDLYCSDGLEYGWYDDINAQRKPCSLGAACAGNESVEVLSAGDDGHHRQFLPGGWVNFTSPLVFYRFRSHIGSSVIFEELDDSSQVHRVLWESEVLTDEDEVTGVIRRSLEQVESESFRLVLPKLEFHSAARPDEGVTLRQDGESYLIYPAPRLLKSTFEIPDNLARVQLRKRGIANDAVLKIYGVQVVPDEDSILGVARLPDGSILSPYGIMDNSTCFLDFGLCAWNTTSGLSVDTSRILCEISGIPVSYPALGRCAINGTIAERYSQALVGRVDGEHLQFEYGVWDLFVLRETFQYFYRIQSSEAVYDLEYLTVDDLRKPCVCIPIGRNQSLYDVEYYSQEKRTEPRVIGSYAVAQRMVNGEKFLFRGVMTTAENPFHMQIPGYSAPVRVTNPKQMSQYEYLLGNPQCYPDVFPTRTATGGCSQLGLFQIDTRVGCECLLSAADDTSCRCTSPETEALSIGLDFTCACDSVKCSCPQQSGIENQLYEFLEDSVKVEECVQTRVGTLRGETQFRPSNFTNATENGILEYIITSPPPLDLPGYPREFLIPVTCNGSVQVWGKSRFFSDEYSDPFNFTLSCVNDTHSVLSLNTSITRVYDEWKLELTIPLLVNPDWLVNVYWTPGGVPITVLDSNIAVTDNAKTPVGEGSNVLMNSHSSWYSGPVHSHVWLELEFQEEHWVNSVWLELRKGGILRVDGIVLSSELRLEYHDGNRWYTANVFKSSVYLSEETVKFSGLEQHLLLLDEPRFMKRIRLYSYFEMEIAVFLPLTDQTCKLGRIQPGFVNVVQQASTILQRSNSSVPCTSVDTCKLNGMDATRDGICQDEHFHYGPMILQDVITLNDTKEQIMFLSFKNNSIDVSTVLFEVVEENRLYHWYLPGENCTYAENTTAYPYEDIYMLKGGCAWFLASNNSVYQFNPELGNLFIQEQRWIAKDRPTGPDLYCKPGTDYSDCGSSNRLSPIDAGLSCVDERIQGDLLDRTKYLSEEIFPVHEFLKFGARYRVYTPQFSLRMTRINRLDVTDCEGRVLCPDGTCSDTDCSHTRYRCRGDGCTLVDPNLGEYKCACRLGYGGISCDIYETNDGDPIHYQVDPSTWHFAGRPPPMRIRPPGGFQKLPYTTPDVLRMMFPGGVDNSQPMILPEAAPYGNVFARYVENVNRKGGFYTTCFFYRKTPWGAPVSRDECVQEYNEDGSVKTWRKFRDLKGNLIEYRWNSYIQYDEFPFRCPKSGHCVAKQSDCYGLDTRYPICNGNGRGLADGTCACNEGWETFLFTDEFTEEKSVPYQIVPGEGTNPTVWGGRPNSNWRTWGPHWCKARDCKKTDCSPPKGCYPGRPEVDFRDGNFTCSKNSPNPGMCAVDSQSCERGEVSEPLLCSGNGIIRRRSYRDEEYYCECGDVVSDDAREITELIPNGWGGPRCDQYYCNEPLFRSYWFEPYDEIKQGFHLNRDGLPLPGIWKSNDCGAPVGPDPDELPLWQNCCPGIKRLEDCLTVPCEIGGSVSCVLNEQCSGIHRVPKIYPCNNHGKPLADGTCDCDEGYTFDYDRFSYSGCFRKVDCPVAPRSQQVCNRREPCGKDFSSWILPKTQYFEQQMYTAIARTGMPITNRTLVRTIAESIGQTERFKEQTYISVAEKVIAAEVDLASCHAVFPDDDPANPRGMRPYLGEEDEIFYERGFPFPYQLNLIDAPEVLKDGRFGSGFFALEGINHHTFNLNDPIVFDLNGTFVVDYVRVHGRKNKTDRVDMEFSIRGDSNNELCSGLSGRNMVISDYDGANDDYRGIWTTQQCGDYYVDYNIRTQRDYQVNCGLDLNSDICLAYQKEQCDLVNGIVRIPGSPDAKPGCTGYCCIQVSIAEKTTRIVLEYRAISFNAEADVSFHMDELVVFGHGDTVLPLPPVLREEMDRATGGQNFGCQDYLLVQTILGNQGEPYLGVDYTSSGVGHYPTMQADAADEFCVSTGGKLATATVTASFSDYAKENGIPCFQGDEDINRDRPIEGCLVGARDAFNYSNAPISLFIEPSCTAYGCFEYQSTASFDIYSTPDIRNSDSKFWGDQWRTPNPLFQGDQLPWAEAAGLMGCHHIRYFDFSMGYRHTTFSVSKNYDSNNIFHGLNSDGSLRLVPIYSAFMGYSNFFTSYGWVYEEVQGSEPADVVEQPKKYSIEPPEWVCDTTLASNELRDQHRLPTSWYFEDRYLSTWDGKYRLPVPFPRPYGHATRNDVLRDESGVRTSTPQPRTVSADSLGSTTGFKYETRIRDGVIETEYWTNEKVCRVTFATGKYCAGQVDNGQWWINLFNHYYSSPERTYTFLAHPGNDYYPFYKDLASGNPRVEHCATVDGQSCRFILWSDFSQDIKNLEGYSIFVEGPCTLHAHNTEKNVKHVFEGVDGATEPRPFAYGTHHAGSVYEPGCYAWPDRNNPDLRFDRFYLYPNFRSAKIRTTVRARSYAAGGQENYNIGWSTHPYMLANVEVKVLATLSRRGPGYGSNRDGVYDFDRGGDWDNPGDFRRPDEMSRREFISVDLGLIWAFRDWFRGGSEASKPRFYSRSHTGLHGFRTDDDLNVYHPFKAAVDYGVDVKPCLKCPKKLYDGSWTWNQQVQLSTLVDFERQVQVMSGIGTAHNGIIGQVVSPTMHVFINNKPLDAREVPQLDVRARNFAYWTKEEYLTEWFLNQCVQVARLTATGNNFRYEPVICEMDHYVLCQRDTNKYIVRSGYQADKCGDSGRPLGIAQPNTTCFDRYPDADPDKSPEKHAIKNSYLTGQLKSLIARSDHNYDESAEFLLADSNSYALVFKEIVSFVHRSISTQPAMTTKGQVEDPISWMNFDLASLYPENCGEVRNPDTGKRQHICATTLDKCDFRFVNAEGTLMDLDSYPKILEPVAASENHIYIKRCGVIVKPSDYRKFDVYGVGTLTTEDFNFIREDETDGSVYIQARYTNGTYVNTGKNSHGYTLVSNITHYVTGSVSCVACQLTLFMSTLDPQYGEPIINRVNILTAVSSPAKFEAEIFHTNENISYQIFGWELEGLEVGETVRLEPLILSNNGTINLCQEDRLRRNWVNPPEAIESGQTLLGECVETERRANELQTTQVGQCYCPGRGTGGRACDSMAMDTYFGNEVCGGVGEGLVNVLGPDLEIYPTDEHGAFYYGLSLSYCKCIDFGSVIRVVRNPSQGRGYEYLTQSSRPRNFPSFQLLRASPDDITLVAPYTHENIKTICAAESNSLPSWATSNLALDFYVDWSGNIQYQPVDLTINSAAQLIWESQLYVIREDVAENSTSLSDADILADSELTRALNFNNLGYLYSGAGNGAITDGVLQNYSQSLTTNFATTPATFVIDSGGDWTSADVEVVIYGFDFPLTGIQVRANGNPCSSGSESDDGTFYVSFCDAIPSPVTMTFSVTVDATLTWKEVAVFNQTKTSDDIHQGRSVYFKK